mmetsp:Transcript_32353/g.45109  ORF Transcript_32353/g.45109 Transcript_32353/m.45109 type:complete len:126 (+) Transcript_32353:277-654(+)
MATLCAFNQTREEQVNFLICMDEESSTTKDALTAAQSCCSNSSIDYSALKQCFAGESGQELLEEASKTFNKEFPGHATVPHTFVNGLDTIPLYDELKSRICEAGSKASICDSFNSTLLRMPSCEI